ncbi:MAG: hypothetical protein WCP55_25000, partial [Lentisphaerota bacterium]
ANVTHSVKKDCQANIKLITGIYFEGRRKVFNTPGQTLHYQLTSVRIGNALASKRVFEIWGNLKKRGQLQKLTLLEFPTPRCDFRGYVAEERWSPDRL